MEQLEMNSTNNSSPFDSRRNTFEESYFRTKDAELVDKLRKVFETTRNKEELSKATGISNQDVLDRLVASNVNGEMMTAFNIYPLVEIAWADGAFDSAERAAVMAAAIKHGIPAGSPVLERLKNWLDRGPNEEARAAWYMYAAELRNTLTPAELNTFREDLLTMARQVAETSGGVLGMFFNLSHSERTVLKDITEALTHSKQ